MRSRIINILKVVAFVSILISSLSTKVNAFSPKTFEAEFEQTRKSSLGKIRKTKGKLLYMYPSHIKLESPEVTTVVNPQKTYFYQAPPIEGEPGELIISSTKDNFLIQAFDGLRKGLKSNKLYKVKKNKNSVELNFSKDYAKKVDLKSLVLTFKGSVNFKNLKSIIVVNLKNKKIEKSIKNLNENLKLSSSDFKFKAPENTRVSQ
tara:strand:+ start:78119 stop:78733 length:615 start_codon:yes stop_codon:yes gene_type:complete